jgi:hypothetical protein
MNLDAAAFWPEILLGIGYSREMQVLAKLARPHRCVVCFKHANTIFQAVPAPVTHSCQRTQ